MYIYLWQGGGSRPPVLMYKLMYILCLLTVTHQYVTYWKYKQWDVHWCCTKAISPPPGTTFLKKINSLRQSSPQCDFCRFYWFMPFCQSLCDWGVTGVWPKLVAWVPCSRERHPQWGKTNTDFTKGDSRGGCCLSLFEIKKQGSRKKQWICSPYHCPSRPFNFHDCRCLTNRHQHPHTNCLKYYKSQFFVLYYSEQTQVLPQLLASHQ